MELSTQRTKVEMIINGVLATITFNSAAPAAATRPARFKILFEYCLRIGRPSDAGPQVRNTGKCLRSYGDGEKQALSAAAAELGAM